MKQTVTTRNSAVELLRICAMLMIVLGHICHHSGFDRTYSIMTVNRLFTQFADLGNLGVAVFVMISGYFHSGLRSRTLSRLLTQVWFYSVALFLVFQFGFGHGYTAWELKAVFMPTLYAEYWFFTAFFVLTLLTPFLNLLIHTMDRRQHRNLVVCMMVLWSMVPTLTGQTMYGDVFPQFLLYYMVGAWFRKYPDNPFREKAILRWGLALGSMAALYILTVVLGYLERYTPEAFGASTQFYARNSLLILSAAMGMLAIAAYTKPFTNRFINTIGGCTFGVYLIHDHPLVRELLWKDWLHWGHYFTSGSFIPRLIVSALLVFAVCTTIEWLRQKTVAKPLENALNRVLRRFLKLPE